MATPKVNLAERAIQRTKEHPSFLGYPLSVFQQARRQSDPELAGWLGCPVDQIGRLSLCRRPVGTDSTFRRDVEAIAVFTGVDAGRLIQVLRVAESIAALRDIPTAGGAGATPLRLAARKAGKAKREDVSGGGKGEGA